MAGGLEERQNLRDAAGRTIRTLLGMDRSIGEEVGSREETRPPKFDCSVTRGGRGITALESSEVFDQVNPRTKNLKTWQIY
jgi:hypothetical protein